MGHIEDDLKVCAGVSGAVVRGVWCAVRGAVLQGACTHSDKQAWPR
jgi:hypothetical protein